MIALIAMKLMETGLGPREAKLASWAIMLMLALALLALWLTYSWAYGRGESHERAVWVQEVASIRKERDKAMAALGKQDATQAGAIETSITDNRKALDDETANLPDQSLSDRQRARACRELVRQGRRCEPSAAAPGKAGS